ncbi:phenolic glucoside malonyltransferase 2-like [Tasmannia lanceolata]|uniref:phenolic glucoside malonyltransferase 2-like n=1 Tax=Tasmannia lanceolata TaxID=3420 RepID=UPI004063E760
MQVNDHGGVPISTFVAVSAHAWVCNLRAIGVNKDEDCCLIFLIDHRKHFAPLMTKEEYFGNCLTFFIVRAKAHQVYGQDGFKFSLPSLMMNIAGSPKFDVYKTDFGLGRPRRIEMVSMEKDGFVGLADAREGGGVQVSVTFSSLHMDKFVSLFLHGLDGGKVED